MGLKAPFLLALNMTEQQQISRTWASGWKAYDLCNLTPAFAAIIVGTAPHGGRLFRSFPGRTAGPYHRRAAIKFYPTSPTITARRCQRSDKPDRIGSAAE